MLYCICDLLEQLSVQVKAPGVNVAKEAYSLEGSFVADGSFTKTELRAMAENWVNVEDDQDIIHAEVDDAIELLEECTIRTDEDSNMFIDDDEPEDKDPINNDSPIPSFLDAESCVNDLRIYCESA